MRIKFFPAGTLFACRYLYIFDANKVVINFRRLKNKGGPPKKLLGKTITKIQLRNCSLSYLPSVWPNRLIVQSQTLPAYHQLFLRNLPT